MCGLSWTCVVCVLFIDCAVKSLDTGADSTLEGSSLGYPDLVDMEDKPHNSTVGIDSPHSVKLSEHPESSEIAARRKRSVLFPSGVKVCAHETVEQVISTHLSYFHLRVCQETVWEAFKVFWGRLPKEEEYQSWISRCQEGAVSAKDIGIYFSQSVEHHALVQRRTAEKELKRELTTSWNHMCSTPTPETPETPEKAGLPEKETRAGLPAGVGEQEVKEAAVVTDASPLDNDIAVAPPAPPALEQAVELSILLTGESFSEELRNLTSTQRQILTRHFIRKIEEALEAMPGFKSVSVLDLSRDGVLVDYAVTVTVGGTGVSSEQLDYLTLQSNRVETSYRPVEGRSMVVEKEKHVNKSTEAARPVHGQTVKLVVDEASESPIIILPQPAEPQAGLGNENDVILLEESANKALAPVPATAATADGMKEEGLMVEDSVLRSLPEDLPVQPVSPVQAEAATLPATLPAQQVESEASGSGPGGPGELLLPSITTEEELSVEEAGAEVSLAVEVSNKASAKTPDTNKEEFAKFEDELAVGHEEIVDDLGEDEEEKVNNDLIDAAGIPQELESITTEIEEEEGDNYHFPGFEVIEETPDQEEPGEDLNIPEVPHTAEDVSPGQPEDAAAINALTTGDPESQGTVEAPTIMAENVTEDEVLLVHEEETEPPVTLSLSPAQPIEGEAPFTRVSGTVLPTKQQPGVDVSITLELHPTEVGLGDVTDRDLSYDIVHYGYGVRNHTQEGDSGLPSGTTRTADQTGVVTTTTPRRALMVFFSLRVTNMMFSDDLFNKSSAEYKALEQRFLELLVPYLQSNLSNFQNLEILNFRNGSIVVNSRMKFDKPVPHSVTTAVYLILEEFCNTAYQTMNLAIDKYSLDVESGDQADPCKFQACNEYAACKVNRWSGEAECVCSTGYFSVDGLPCQSICELQTDFCLNDGKCDIIPGHGAICRCRVGENWWYRGEHCQEYVSEPLVVGIAIVSVAGFLLVASGVIFFLARTLRDQYDKDDAEDPIRQAESLPSPERATKYNPMFESEATTGYSHYYRRYPEAPIYSSGSGSAEASTEFSSEEIKHIYENSELTKEEIQDRIRIIELYAKDRQFADFTRQHQTGLDAGRESSSVQT